MRHNKAEEEQEFHVAFSVPAVVGKRGRLEFPCRALLSGAWRFLRRLVALRIPEARTVSGARGEQVRKHSSKSRASFLPLTREPSQKRLPTTPFSPKETENFRQPAPFSHIIADKKAISSNANVIRFGLLEHQHALGFHRT